MSKIVQRLEQSQKLNPKQILEQNIIQLSIFNLEKRILEELEQNPALEIVENEEDVNDKENDENEEFDFEELVSNPEEYEYSKKTSTSDTIEKMVETESSNLFDDIMTQLNEIDVSDQELVVAEQILGNLDDRGFLPIEPILIADRLGFKESFVYKVKQKIQSLDPAGIGSESIQDCILAQLKKYYPEDKDSFQIVNDYFDEFSNHKYDAIAKKMDCTKDKVFETVEKVSVLNPSPAINYSTEVVNHIIPDVVIENINGEWDVQVNDPGVPAIGLSNQYIKMLENNKDASVKNFIKQKLNKAKWFISAIEQRNSTMIKVMKSIINKQTDYFDSDDRLLVPMILKDVALDVDMDISTISRVTNGKYVQMPWGTKELKRFFSEGIKLNDGKIVSSVVFKEKLKLFLDNEDKSNPYTDEQLTKELNKKGYDIARRTVSKYREMLKIPVARLRKI